MAQAHDEDLYCALREIGTYFDESIWLSDHIRISQEERDAFLNNETENPRFRYRKQMTHEDHSERLGLMYQVLHKSTAPAVVVDLYERKIKKQLLRNVLITASVSKDDNVFYLASRELYGKPKKKYFSYVAKRVSILCTKQKKLHPGAARRLWSVLGKINTIGVDIDASVLPPPIMAGKLIKSITEVEKIFQSTLDRCGIEGWTLQIDDTGERSRFSVNPSQKTIFIPSEVQLLERPIPLTVTQIQALAEHEIGVHVRRVYEASQGPLRLLEIGLDSYLTGEEGLAGYVQQQITGANEFYGIDRYLAACLAVGMDGEVRDFRAVFSLMTDFYTLQFSADGNNSDTAPFRAAWDVCVRIFRGTTGQTPGTIYTKDIVYMEGNIGIWHLLSEKPHIFESLFVGKFNPLLSRHVRTLQTLEILKEW